MSNGNLLLDFVAGIGDSTYHCESNRKEIVMISVYFKNTNRCSVILLQVLVLLFWIVPVALAGGSSVPPAVKIAVAAPAPVYGYDVVASFPHDPQAFTQGLVFEKGHFFESTGLYGNSSVRKVDASTGKVMKRHKLPGNRFGEGLALYDDLLIQLTWRSGVGFVYDKEGFSLVREFSYYTEGWGLTFDGKRLVMSDGSSTLHFLDPDTFAAMGTIEVRDHQGPVYKLNELEVVGGEVWANVLPTDRIARIDPHTGWVIGWIDLTGLLSVQRPNPVEKPLNGIAYDRQNNRIFVTGKLWPKVFEIKVVPGP